MVIAHRSRDPALIAHTAGIVVLADTVFTATAALIQPVTGYLLARSADLPVFEGWVLASLALYLLVGAFWLPVVWIQIRLHAMARSARDAGTPLPRAYWTLYRVWRACGVPAFAAVLAILWLMITRPAL